MKVTAIDLVELSGDLTELQVQWTGAPLVCDAPTSFNQANHIRTHQRPPTPEESPDTGRTGGWLAGIVEVCGASPPVPTRLAMAVGRLLSEHDALRARLRLHPNGAVHQDVFGPDQVSVAATATRPVTGAQVRTLLDTRCNARDTPGVWFAVLDHRVIVGIDHAHGDALTIDLMLRRLVQLYADPTAAPRPGHSYLNRCRAEAESDDAADHPALAGWHDFFAATGGTVPTFPLPLGYGAQGQHRRSDEVDSNILPARKKTVVVDLLDTSAAQSLGRRPFATLLATLADTVAALGGPRSLAAMIPVHTRGDTNSGWHETAGWLVTNAPVIVPAGDAPGAAEALRNAISLAAVPLPLVLAECRPRLPDGDLFMVSYLDYRKCGPSLPGAQHISSEGRTSDIQLWFSRHHDGLDLRVRYPDTAAAADIIRSMICGLRERLEVGPPSVVGAALRVS